MAQFERSIKLAVDRLSGELIVADEAFAKSKEAFAIRHQAHSGELDLYCRECNQKLTVPTSKYDRIHFRHLPNAEYCILKDGNLSPEEIEQFNKILIAKESERHKELKRKIAKKLLKVEGVDAASITIDDKFIIRGNEKRRPDVYCRYWDKQLVFEIQLSNLSLRYILSRYNFYKKHSIYLIWVLDNFDVHKQGQLERDIKYLSEHQNFFNLDEKVEDFKLECRYKFTFLTDQNQLLSKWKKKSVELNQITFDDSCFQIYYYNYGKNALEVEKLRKRNHEKILEVERKRLAQQQLNNAKLKAHDIINKIWRLRQVKSQDFRSASIDIFALNDFEVVVFNNELGLNKSNNEPALHRWIKSATQEDVAFIEFILSNREIILDVNQKNSEGSSVLKEIFLNASIYKYVAVKALMKRDYALTQEDQTFFSAMSEADPEMAIIWQLCKLSQRLNNRHLTDYIFNQSKLFLIIESARLAKITGFNYRPTEWIAFANNAIQYYGHYWEYIELAFKCYGLWSKLIQLDKKGTFQRKVQIFYSDMPKQLFDVDETIRDLYPELMAAKN